MLAEVSVDSFKKLGWPASKGCKWHGQLMPMQVNRQYIVTTRI